jgi:hypothetical protein
VQLPTSNLVHNNETENGFADQSRDAADSRERAGLRGWVWNTPAFFHNYEKKSDRVRSRRSSRLANFGLPYRMDSIFLSRDMSHDQSATNLRGAELIGGQSQTQQEHGRVQNFLKKRLTCTCRSSPRAHSMGLSDTIDKRHWAPKSDPSRSLMPKVPSSSYSS